MCSIRHILFLILLIISQNINAGDILSSIVSTESDPDAFIDHSVNVINGEYCEADTDLIIKGPDNLLLQRFYNSKNYVNGKHEGSWRYLPQRFLVLGKDLSIKSRVIGKETFHWAIAFAGEQSGGILPYCGWRANTGSTKDPLEIDIFEHAHGLVNTYTKEISGQTNHHNNKLHSKTDSCELSLGNGSRRIFKRVDRLASSIFGEELVSHLAALVQEPEYFLLTQEIMPSGNVICYTYDSEGHLAKIELKNSSQQKILSWMQFYYNFQDGKSLVKVTTSDEKAVAYHFTDQLKRVEGSHLIPCSYEYQASRLTKKNLPLGQFVEIEYDKTGKVSALKKPNAISGKVELVQSFSYEEGITDVCNALGIKSRYRYDKRKQLTHIESYDSGSKLYRKIRKVWGNSKKEAGLLLAKITEDGSSRIHSYQEFKYDERGNILEERLYGNLTGKDEVSLSIDNDNRLVNPDKEECHVKNFEYSKDGFNLLTQIGDSKGNKTSFLYKPGTNLLVKKFIYEKSSVKKRAFYSYDENACIIRVVEDDGYDLEENQTYGVKERHITVYKPKQAVPGFGLSEIIEERGWNLKDHREYLVRKVTKEYDPQGREISAEMYDANGAFQCREKRSYNQLGLVTTYTDAMGRLRTYEYDQLGNKILESILHENKTVTYKYDFRNQLVEVRGQGSDLELVSRNAYDILGRKVCSTDYFGNTTTFEYDSFGRILKVTYPEVLDENRQIIKPTFSYSYDIFGNAITIIDPKGYSISRAYNLRGDVTRISYPDGTSELFKYDTEGSLHRSLSRDLLVTIYEYDYLGRCTYEELSSMTLKGDSSYIKGRKHSYNAFRCTSTDVTQYKETYRFDSLGRIIALVSHDPYDSDTNPTARLTEFFYDALGRVNQKKVWFDAGAQDYTIEHFVRDLAGNVLEKRIEDAQGKVLYRKAFAYDLSDRCVEEMGFDQGRAFPLSISKYNSQGQPISICNALGQETQVIIDYSFQNSLGQKVLKTTYIDPVGVLTEIEYDALNRVVKTIKKDRDGSTLSCIDYFYNAVGNKCSQINHIFTDGVSSGVKTLCWIYGPMGRIEEEIEAFGTAEEKRTIYSYNALGQMSTMQLAGAQSPIVYSYDKTGKVAKIEYSEGKMPKISNTYEYDKNGNILRAKCLNDIIVERTYNAFHQPLTETVSDGEGKYTLSYNYDRKGRLKAITLPDKSKVAYQFDALFGRKVERFSANGESLYHHAYDEYDEQGRLLGETLIGYAGNQVHAYDAAGQRVQTRNDFTVEQYGYDQLGRNVEINKNDVKNSFTYNGLSQLTSETGNVTVAYGYNSLDDRQDRDLERYSYNARNQLLESPVGSYSYDPQGNLQKKATKGDETHFEFSILSQLTTVKKSNNETYRFIYDAFGRLLVKKKLMSDDKQAKPITTARYLNLGYLEIGTLTKSGSLETLKVPGIDKEELSLESIAFEVSGEAYVPLHSLNGNVIAILEPKKAQLLESYNYSAFGEESIYNASGELIPTSSIGIPWRFAEKRACADTGLVHFGRRFYDASVGSWISPDPIGFGDGPNTYAYLHNNPLNYRDRFGLAAEEKAPSIDLKYLYGEVEDHCFCEKHRTCKRGGDIGKSDSASLPKITYNDHFENWMEQIDPQARRSTIFDLSDEGLPELPSNLQIGFINGIMNTLEEAKESARYLSALSGGYNIHAVYNATHELQWDLVKCKIGLDFIAIEPVRQLHKMWNSYFEKSSDSAKFLMICHSQGAIHVRNALLDYSPDLRNRILVVAIAPGGYIYEESCAQVLHYRVPFHRDFVPLFDRAGRKREERNTVELACHPDAEVIDHSFLSPTYRRKLVEAMYNYIQSAGGNI